MVTTEWRNVSSRSGSQSDQQNHRRHKWYKFKSLDNTRCNKSFSADKSREFLPQENAKSSIYAIESLPSKRGYELEHPERKGRRKRRGSPLKRRLRNCRGKMFVPLDSPLVPLYGTTTDTLIQSTENVPGKKDITSGNQKHSRRGRRGEDRSRISIRENDLTAPFLVDHDHCTSSNQNMSSGLNYKQNRKRRRSRSRKRADERCCDVQCMGKSSLQSQVVNHASVIRNPDKGKSLKNAENKFSAYNLVALTEEETNSFADIGKCSKQSENNQDTVSSHIDKWSKQRKMSRKCKKSTSSCEEVENHSPETANSTDSIIREGKDAAGYLPLKNGGSLDDRVRKLPVSPERSLRRISRKKLLVLDLNGILCDVIFGIHVNGVPHKKVNKRSVFKRPFVDDFLTFCFEKFAVGIWSSRNKRNIDGVIDYIMGASKDKLLFCWDQSKCTPTGFNTIDDRRKPLFLKELNKLWNKEETSLPWEKGDYLPFNTLLVDDSPYKALCNPPYTAIFPFSYDFRNQHDSSLGPRGDIRVYLEGIAIADDVQEYVKEHAFGQQAITCEHEMWSFYGKIAQKNNSIALTN